MSRNYSRMKVTDEQIIEEYEKGKSNRKIAESLDMCAATIDARIKRLKENNVISSSNSTLVKGTSTLYDNEGNVKLQWVKTKASKELQKEQEELILNAFIEKLPVLDPNTYFSPEPSDYDEDLMAVYPLGDPHVGMLAWGDECGENWDLKLAEEILCAGFSSLVKDSPRCKQAVIVNVGDFFHYDNFLGITERSGNVLDKDGRFAKMVSVGIKIMRQMIETALVHHESVRVINAVGNHDETGAIWLARCLYHMYENEPRIVVDTSPTPYHYVRFGKVLIGVHHGHTTRKEGLAGIMAADRARDWGETEYRYWLTGHIHQSTKIDPPGCQIESFRTLAARDSYATWHGFRSGRNSQAIIYHKDYGEKRRYIFTINELQAKK